MVRSLLVLLAIGGVASAADPTAWRLTRVISGARDGLTQFQVLRLDAHGGEVRIIRSPRDETCPSGATYVIGWRIDGELRRVGLGQTLVVSYEGRQVSGGDCPNSEPNARAGLQGLYALNPGPGWGPGQYVYIEGPGGHEFYVRPDRHPDRHASQFRVGVPRNAYQPRMILVLGIDTSGNSGGQWFNVGLLYEAEQPGAPPLPPVAPQPGPYVPPPVVAPAPGALRATYVGCFADQGERDLPDGFMEGGMSIERCAEHCRNAPYFGVQYGNQCFCGNRYGRYGQAAGGECNMPCSGNPAQMCGGNWRNSVYQIAGAPLGQPPPPYVPPPPPSVPAPRPMFAIDPAWLGTLYYRWGDQNYVLTLSAPGGVLDGRIRTRGPRSDPRHLYNFRLAKPDVLDGDWESDPIYDSPIDRKRGRKRGTFRAVFYSSSGNTWYIFFTEGPSSEIEPGGVLNNSWFREPY